MKDPKYHRIMYRLPLQWGVEPFIAKKCLYVGSGITTILFITLGWIFKGIIVGGVATYFIIKVAQKFNESDARFFESYWSIAMPLGKGRQITSVGQNNKIRRIKP